MPEYEHYEKTGEKTGMLLDTSYEVQKHAPTSGIVVSVPKQLNYSMSNVDVDMLAFKTTMDILPGDRVIFGYNTVDTAMRSGRQINGLVCLRYDSLFCAMRKGKIIMLNGYVIVEAVEDKTDDEMVPDYMRSVNNFTKGKIAHVGKGNEAYRYYPELGSDGDNFKEGDYVLFNLQYSIPLQYQMHSIIDSNKELYRMQQKDISAIIEEYV